MWTERIRLKKEMGFGGGGMNSGDILVHLLPHICLHGIVINKLSKVASLTISPQEEK